MAAKGKIKLPVIHLTVARGITKKKYVNLGAAQEPILQLHLQLLAQNNLCVGVYQYALLLVAGNSHVANGKVEVTAKVDDVILLHSEQLPRQVIQVLLRRYSHFPVIINRKELVLKIISAIGSNTAAFLIPNPTAKV